jgi:hypothetical protein
MGFFKKSLVDVARPFFLQNDEKLPKTKTLVWSLAIMFNRLKLKLMGPYLTMLIT